MALVIDTPEIEINVGSLQGLGSLFSGVSASLEKFSTLYQKGAAPAVIWNLAELQPRRINLAALTAFLAIAFRLRRFTDYPPILRPSDDSDVNDFLADISFFAIGREYKLWRFEPGRTTGLVKPGRTNPNSNIFIVNLGEVPSRIDEIEFNAWKDWVRGEIKKELLLKCGPLFKPHQRTAIPYRKELVDELSITTAELGLNSVIHGRSPAFVGLQRTSARITVAISDCGVGFLRTLQEYRDQAQIRKNNNKQALSEIPEVETDIQALLLGSLINRKGYGVRRAISTVIRSGGWVNISSGNAQIEWRGPLWDRIVSVTGERLDFELNEKAVLGSDARRDAGHTRRDKGLGYYRIFENELRGTRVSFEMPLE
jgi:hypothetical protein